MSVLLDRNAAARVLFCILDATRGEGSMRDAVSAIRIMRNAIDIADLKQRVLEIDMDAEPCMFFKRQI